MDEWRFWGEDPFVDLLGALNCCNWYPFTEEHVQNSFGNLLARRY